MKLEVWETPMVQVSGVLLARGAWLGALLCVVVLSVTKLGNAATWPGNSWSTISPNAAGVDQTLLNQAVSYGRQGDSAGMIVLGGRILAQWGNTKKQYSIRSATKSIGSIALGLAIDEGRTSLNSFGHTILSEIATPPTSNTNKGWHREITIEHLATHTAGFDKAGGFEKLLFRPGTAYAYSDGGANWLADILTAIYNKDLRTLMREEVFRPIGINDSDLSWRNNRYRSNTLRGKPRREFGSGINTGADALARIGLLMAREGLWKTKRILSASYVRKARSTRPLLSGLQPTDKTRFAGATKRYGLLWWNNADGRLANVPRDAFWAWGLDENLIIAVPSLDLVISRAGSDGLQSGWQPDYDVIEPLLGIVVSALPDEDDDEPPVGDDFGDSLASAGSMRLGEKLNGRIESASDSDWIKISLRAGLAYRFDVEAHGTDPLTDPHLRLLDDKGQQVSFDNNGGKGSNARLVYRPLTNGTHVIAVKAADGKATGGYRISAGKKGGDDFSANTATAGQLIVGKTARGRIEQTSDKDWQAIRLIAGQSYRIDVGGIGDDPLVDAYVRLRDNQGAVMASDNNGGPSRDARLIHQATRTGNYFVHVHEAGFNAIGDYQVSVTQTSSDPAPPPPSPPSGLSVNAGPDITAKVNVKFLLDGSASAGASTNWRVVEAEGGKDWAVKILKPAAPSQMIKVTRAGRYVVELSATDGGTTVQDRAVLTIND